MSGILQMVFAATSGSGPINTVAPVVTGTAQVRQTLTCSTGTWVGAEPITYTYQWQQGTTNIIGATSSTYIISSTYVGIALRCVVTATNIGGSKATSSNATSAVVANIPVVPTIGTATSISPTSATVAFTPGDNGGAPVTAYTATSSPGGITGSSTGSPITVSGLSENTSYTFTVTATNSVGTTAASSASNSITTGITPPVNTVAPVISGGGAPAIVFSIWSCTTGTWTGSPTSYLYVWYAGGSVVQSSSSPSYAITSSDVGKTLQCYVTASNSGGGTAAGSNTTAAIIPNVPRAPTIGTATSTGSTTATVAFTAGDNGGAAITSFTARTQNPGGIISTGTTSPITVTGLSPYTTYTFIVAATNSVGTGSYSNQSNQITTNAVVPVNTVAPVLSGTAQAHAYLSSSTGSWSGIPTPTYSYQWQEAGGIDLPGETGSSIYLLGYNVGTVVRCRVAATNAGGGAVAYTAYSSTITANTPLAPYYIYAEYTATPTPRVGVTFYPSDNGGAAVTQYTIKGRTAGGTVFTTTNTTSTNNVGVPFQYDADFYYTVTATNSVGTSTDSSPSNTLYVARPLVYNKLFMVAGGGAGGSNRGGGGGGGRVWEYDSSMRVGSTYTVSVGAGGAATANTGGQGGGFISFDGPGVAISIAGGGGGGKISEAGANGGSGGGGGYPSSLATGGGSAIGAYGVGFDGAPGLFTTGGGGGASGTPTAPNTPNTGGNGGQGVSSSALFNRGVSGSGGGGGGGTTAGGTGGTNAGNGGKSAVAGGNGTAQYGGGGGGGGASTSIKGGNGGSGIFVLAVPDTQFTGTYTGATISTRDGYVFMTFTTSGTYTA